MAQRELIQLMKEMTLGMETVEPDEVPEEPEEWSPTRVETVEAETDRPTRPTPPTRPPAMTTTETKRTIDMCKVNAYQDAGFWAVSPAAGD